MKSFASKYAGKCKICSRNFPAGTLIVWNRTVKGQVAHDTCYQANGNSFNLTSGQTAEKSTFSDYKDVDVTETGLTLEQTELDETIEAQATEKASQTNDLAAMIAAAVQPLVKAPIDETKVREICKTSIDKALTGFQVPKIDDSKIVELIQAHTTKRIEVVTPQGEVRNVGRQHKQFPELLAMCNARDDKGNRLNIWLTGPAGTGKTTAAQKVAEALGLEFSTTGSLTDCYTQIFGYPIPQTGEVFKTLWRERWINGGVFVLDDFDGSDPIEAIKMNTATANGHCPFPDINAPRHPDFILILTANTFGLGGTDAYVGRVKQDAAFLDRFVTLNWEIDETLERETCSRPEWVKRVQSVRAKVKKNGIRVLVTPRASYYGAALLNAGLSQEQAERAALRKAMTDDQWALVS